MRPLRQHQPPGGGRRQVRPQPPLLGAALAAEPLNQGDPIPPGQPVDGQGALAEPFQGLCEALPVGEGSAQGEGCG